MPLAGALETAHEAGIIHRDVKPDNVLFDGAGMPRLSDFGISLAEDSTRSRTGTFVGTVSYVAPEILKGEEATPRSDVYSLGGTVFTALVGWPAYGADGMPVAAVIHQILNDPVPDLTGIGVPIPLCRIVQRALASEPTDRFPTMVELGRALQECQHALALEPTAMVVGSRSLVHEASPKVPTRQTGPKPAASAATTKQDPADVARETQKIRPDTLRLPSRVTGHGTPRRPRRTIMLVAGIAIAIVCVVVGVAWWRSASSPVSSLAVQTVASLLDAYNIAADDSAVWVSQNSESIAAGGTVSRIDPASHSVTASVELDHSHELVSAFGSVWVVNAIEDTLVRLDATDLAVEARIDIPEDLRLEGATAGALWLLGGYDPSTLLRVDPTTNQVTAEIEIDIAADYGEVLRGNDAPADALWIETDGNLLLVDPATNQIADTVYITDNELWGVAVAAGSVWTADRVGGKVIRIDATTKTVLATIAVDRPSSVVADDQAVWVRSLDDDGNYSLYKIDPRTDKVVGKAADVTAFSTATRSGSAWIVDGENLMLVD